MKEPEEATPPTQFGFLVLEDGFTPPLVGPLSVGGFASVLEDSRGGYPVRFGITDLI